MNIFKLFKKADKKPLPTYNKIEVKDIPECAILLFYGGTKLTQIVGSNIYKHPYYPPSFHAAFYIEDGLFLNVGKFRTISEIEKEFRSTRRIDVVIPKLIGAQREVGCKYAYLDASRPKVGLSLPDYSWTDFLRFGLRFLKPSKKQFCSENVVLLFQKIGVKVSDLKPEDTAPWDLYEYAIAHPDQFTIRTLHLGDEFKP